MWLPNGSFIVNAIAWKKAVPDYCGQLPDRTPTLGEKSERKSDVNSVVDKTNQYSVEKHGQSVNTSCQEWKKLMDMIFYMELAPMPNLHTHWENEPVASVLSGGHFLKLVIIIILIIIM